MSRIMQKVDRRILRTERLLMDALVALALEKSYDAITVRDITERADVSYSTFFRHYTEIDDLLSEVLKTVVDDLTRLIKHSKSRESEGLLIFQHVAANAAFFRVMFSSPGTSRVMQKLRDDTAAVVLESAQFPANSLVPPEIAANHMVAAILALIRWWLDHDMPYSVERMGQIYSRLIIEATAYATQPE